MSGVQQKNFYEILGVGAEALAIEIDRAYRALIGQFMAGAPPSAPEGMTSKEHLLLIQEAYHTLSKPDRRLAYDRQELGRGQPEVGRSAVAAKHATEEIPLPSASPLYRERVTAPAPRGQPEVGRSAVAATPTTGKERPAPTASEAEPVPPQVEAPESAKHVRRNVYQDYFGFTEKPFDLTPDPKYLYLSPKHKEVLAHLLYGIQENSGFLKIVGEVGTGKTTLCRTFLRGLHADFNIAYIFNPWITALELLQAINKELGIAHNSNSKKELTDILNEFLLQERQLGHRVVVIIDEAQDLDPVVLEQLRLISNLETETEKLIQIVLIGQPELDQLLAADQLRQLRQRITIQWELLPLNPDETWGYIQHRLTVAMGRGKAAFTRPAARLVYKYTQGIPRMINVLSDRALLIAYTRNTKRVNSRIVRLAAKDVGGLKTGFAWARLFLKGVLPTAILLGALWYGPRVIAEWPRISIPAPQPAHVDVQPSGVPSAPSAELLSGASVVAPQLAASAAGADAKETPPVPGASAVASVAPTPASSATLSGGTGAPLVFAQTPTLVTYLSSLSLMESKIEAAKWVLKEWQVPPDKVSAMKEASFARSEAEFGLSYYEMNGNLERLVTLNYPVILELTLPDLQGTKYLALTAIHGNQGVFGSVDRIEMPLSMVDALWTRKTIIFWKDFERLPTHFGPGYQGRETVWLQKNLRLLGFFKGQDEPLYNGKTVEAVLGFQRRHNLRDDGRFGPESRMLLYNLLDVYAVPELKKDT
jgi:general secretion pathway protein A